jgi:lysophospholipase
MGPGDLRRRNPHPIAGAPNPAGLPPLFELIDLPVNPLPTGAVCSSVKTSDGIALRTAYWPAARHPVSGTVLILQGRAEFIEKYFETISELTRRGFSVATFDWRGQGGSDRLLKDGHKGHVDDFSHYLLDLDAVISGVVLADCPPPYTILAHSTGGTIALLYARRARTRIERMVLTAPLLALAGNSTARLGAITGLLGYLGLAKSYVPGGGATLVATAPFAGNAVSSDPRRYARQGAVVDANPALGIGSPTIGWIHAATRAFRVFQSEDFAAQMPIPVLIAIAGADSVVANRVIENFAIRMKMVTSIRLPGSRHEILMERDIFRDPFWAAFDEFCAHR